MCVVFDLLPVKQTFVASTSKTHVGEKAYIYMCVCVCGSLCVCVVVFVFVSVLANKAKGQWESVLPLGKCISCRHAQRNAQRSTLFISLISLIFPEAEVNFKSITKKAPESKRKGRESGEGGRKGKGKGQQGKRNLEICHARLDSARLFAKCFCQTH